MPRWLRSIAVRVVSVSRSPRRSARKNSRYSAPVQCMPPARRGLVRDGRSYAPVGNNPVRACHAAKIALQLAAPVARIAIKPAICMCEPLYW